MTGADVRQSDLVDFVVAEARLLDARRFDEWNRLFTDEAFYWIPLTPDQPEGLEHTSHLYEDKLLRDLRIARYRSPRAFSQQPPSRCHHLLQTPTVEVFEPQANRFVVRSEFHYTEYQTPGAQAAGDRHDGLLFLVGTQYHHLSVVSGALRITLKRVDLLNCDGPLPAVQLFI